MTLGSPGSVETAASRAAGRRGPGTCLYNFSSRFLLSGHRTLRCQMRCEKWVYYARQDLRSGTSSMGKVDSRRTRLVKAKRWNGPADDVASTPNLQVYPSQGSKVVLTGAAHRPGEFHFLLPRSDRSKDSTLEATARGQLAVRGRAEQGETRSFQYDQSWRDRRVETLSGAAPWVR